MDLGLKGKRALVTGGTRGIGRAIADLLAAEGCDVALCARNPDQVSEAVAALQATGVKAWGEALDVSAEGAGRARHLRLECQRGDGPRQRSCRLEAGGGG
jgi:NAD(P)-dependent dehydrogenase (short-subunit alcohol dehydrogenase family)